MVSQLSEKTHFFNNLGELMLYCRELKGEKCEGKLLQNKSTENITGSLFYKSSRLSEINCGVRPSLSLQQVSSCIFLSSLQ